MRRSLTILSILLTLLMTAILIGCQSAPTPAPTVDPSIYTQTAEAHFGADFATRQALNTVAAKLNAQLSFTPTFTDTAMPTRTASPTASQTPAPSKLPTRTATPQPSSTITRTLSSLECRLISQDPQDGTTFKTKDNFTLHWVVQNVGNATWTAKYTDYIQTGGDKVAQLSGYDLSADVKPLDKAELTVFVVAPDEPGSYRMDWKLVQTDNGHLFCPINFQFWVSDK